MKKIKKLLLFTMAVTALMLCFVFSSSAATSGYYTYEIVNGKAKITDVNTSISGDVTVPSKLGGYTVDEIGSFAFQDCVYITNVTIPDVVKTIGKYAFTGCESLVNCKLPNKITTINTGLFGNCLSLQRITIPETVTTIADWAFFSCRSLETLTIPNNVKSIGDKAFSFCDYIRKVNLGNSLISIGYEAFSNCSNLSTINFPSKLKTIGDFAFTKCYMLKNVDIPDSTTSIGTYAFSYCENLENVNIGNSISIISKGTFGYCVNLDYVIVPYSVKTIEEFAFYRCDSLNAVYYEGYASNWKNIVIKENNDCLYQADLYPSMFELPSNFRGKSNCRSVWFSWDPIEGALGYRVYIKSGNSWKAIKNVTKPQITVEGLEPGTKYTFAVKVYGRHPNGKIFYEDGYTSTYSATKPVNILKINTQQLSDGINITWNKVKCSGYRIYLKTTSGWKTLITTTTTSYKATGLENGKKYVFAVRPYTRFGNFIAWSEKYTSATTVRLATPTVSLASTAKGRATIAWTNVAGETGYQVYYSTKKDSGYSKIANYTANTVKAYKTGLRSGYTYYFRVRAYTKTDSGYVYSAFSAVKSVKIK